MRPSWADPRRAAAAAALAVAGLAAGCGGGHAGHPAPTASATSAPAHRAGGDRPLSPAEQVQALLDRRASALEHGSGRARTATALHGARRGAGAARALGLRDVRMAANRLQVRGRRARGTVVTAWSIRGIRGTFTNRRTDEFRRTPHGWRVARELGRRGLAPWEVGTYVRRDLPHFVVLAPRGLDVSAAGLPATLEDGYARFAATLPRARLRHRYLVVVAASAAGARSLTQDIRGIESLAAVADSAVDERGPAESVARVVSQRLLVVWPAFSGLGPDERRRVVAHELTHLVLAAATSGRTPSWLVEGIAMYVSGDRRTDQARAILDGVAGGPARSALSLRALSSPNAIARLSGTRQTAAYAYASAAAFAIADRYGRRELLRLYDAFGDPRLRGGPGAALVSRALRRTVGQGLGAFEAQLRAGLS